MFYHAIKVTIHEIITFVTHAAKQFQTKLAYLDLKTALHGGKWCHLIGRNFPVNDSYRTVVIDEKSLSYVLSVCLSVCHSIYLSVCQSICQSVWLSVCLSVCQSVCLAANLPQHKFVFNNTASNRCVNLLQQIPFWEVRCFAVFTLNTKLIF